MARTHVIGAGMAGLGAAVALVQAGRAVTLWEAAPRAGGRCRSHHDAKLGCVIDNGNHLVLSGNGAVADYLATIGAADRLVGPAEACVPFVDIRSGRRWAVRPNRGRLPWWLFSAGRRPPGFGWADVAASLRVLRAGPGATLGELLPAGPTRAGFWEPLVLAVMNAPLAEAAARPMAAVLRETFGRGGAACRPLVARTSLADTFVDPAISWLSARGAEVHFGRRIQGLERDGDGAVSALRLDGGEAVALDPGDSAILAVPPWIARTLLPDCPVPEGDSAIVNVHFRLDGAVPEPVPGVPLVGLVGAIAHWVFLRGDIASVTISAADDLADTAAEAIIATVWPEVAAALGLDATADVPPARVVKERRATFRQTPANQALRPPAERYGRRLLLAGDWTDTGLPATIEGSLRSGRRAAALALQNG
ncbi:MAG: hydroxysqualene dehydroxylase HpnE [Rhodospirillaceae bacterium]|nr:hydroxysqualene dehydroxylase HpnE [Rhodospirillaceae bacterium]